MYKILAKTLFVGKKLIFLPTCHSTNEVAAQLIKTETFSEGTIIITDNQTAGKGQRGNSWEAAPHQNLTFSIILRPSFLQANQQFQLNIAISLAIFDFLSGFSNNFFVKWPNDLYHLDHKIGGILIQNSLKGVQIDSSIIGIGLNINQTDFQYQKATSLKNISSNHTALSDCLEKLCGHIEARYLQLKSGAMQSLKEAYMNNLLGFGEERLFKAEDIFSGKIVGVDANGLLEIETPKGIRKFAFKEVVFL